mgnify:CR=1 FL=1
MCFNIEEHIYGFIIVTLILIILIACSIYLHKKKNIASNVILSIWSISLSAIAIIVTMIRVDVYFTNDSFVGIMAGFMGACATIIVGAQIYNSIDTSKKIKELERLQEQVTKDIEFLKKEREKGDHFTKYGVCISLGRSTIDNNVFFSYDSYFDALTEALILNNTYYINTVISDIEAICTALPKIQNLKPAKIFNPQRYKSEELEKYPSYLLIKDRYTKCYKTILKAYKECIKQSQTAS